MKKILLILLLGCFFSLTTFYNAKAEISPKIEATDLYKEKIDSVEVFKQKNKEFDISDEDLYLMAQTVFAESGSESFQGKVAVASVILNRVRNPNFPHSIRDVIMQKCAFSCVKNGKIEAIPDESCYQAVFSALKGNDPTLESVFFYNPKTATSTWMKNVNKKNSKTIGNHVFFKI